MEIEGVDVSGHWSTFINSRAVTDYNEQVEEEIAALPGGEFIDRCWQCGSCTNSCTVNAINPDFNPRYWIYLIRMGLKKNCCATRTSSGSASRATNAPTPVRATSTPKAS